MKKRIGCAVVAVASVAAGVTSVASADIELLLGDYVLNPGELVTIDLQATGTIDRIEIGFDYGGNTDGSFASDVILGVVSSDGSTGIEAGGVDLDLGLDPSDGAEGNWSEIPSIGIADTYKESITGFDIDANGFIQLILGDGWTGGTEMLELENVRIELFGADLIPAPGAIALLGLAGIAGTRRRRG